jgi:hypothetical protein
VGCGAAFFAVIINSAFTSFDNSPQSQTDLPTESQLAQKVADMSNLNSWEDDPAAQEENLAQQAGQMNLSNNQGQSRGFRPGASSFTPGAASFQPGQPYGGSYMPQGQFYGGQGYGYGQQYPQYGQGGYNNVYGQNPYNQFPGGA